MQILTFLLPLQPLPMSLVLLLFLCLLKSRPSSSKPKTLTDLDHLMIPSHILPPYQQNTCPQIEDPAADLCSTSFILHPTLKLKSYLDWGPLITSPCISSGSASFYYRPLPPPSEPHACHIQWNRRSIATGPWDSSILIPKPQITPGINLLGRYA